MTYSACITETLYPSIGFAGGSDGKESVCNAGDLGLSPGSERFAWRREWLPTLVFLPGEFMDRGAWRATVHRVTKYRGKPFPSPGDLPNPGIKPGLPHCREILYQLSHQENPRILEWVAYPFFSRSSLPRNQTGVSCIAGGFFTSGATREALSSPQKVCFWHSFQYC